MLTITIPDSELFNERTMEIILVKGKTITLAHSLLSISKWEAIHKKPFLHTDLTIKEKIDYIKCMTITPNVDPLVYEGLTQSLIKQIDEYKQDSRTATVINDRRPKTGRGELVTSELIYYWMVSYGIPFEAQKWNFNRLMTLIQICSIKESSGGGKMSKRATLAQFDAINKSRLGRSGIRG